MSRWPKKKLEDMAGHLYRFGNTFKQPLLIDTADYLRYQYENFHDLEESRAEVARVQAEISKLQAASDQLKTRLTSESRLKEALKKAVDLGKELQAKVESLESDLKAEKDARASERLWLDLAHGILKTCDLPDNQRALVDAIGLSGVPSTLNKQVALYGTLLRLCVPKLQAHLSIAPDPQVTVLVDRIQKAIAHE